MHMYDTFKGFLKDHASKMMSSKCQGKKTIIVYQIYNIINKESLTKLFDYMFYIDYINSKICMNV